MEIAALIICKFTQSRVSVYPENSTSSVFGTYFFMLLFEALCDILCTETKSEGIKAGNENKKHDGCHARVRVH